MRMLLVEDEKKVSDLVARALRAERYAVDVAADGERGWELAQAYDYDLIILDLMLPSLGGAELRARAAAEALRTVEDNVSRDVQIAWLNLNNARERRRTTAQLRRYAATAYDLADARYRAGSSSIVELSQAQLVLTAAQIDETTARYEVLIREADLTYQIGAPATADAPPPEAGRTGADALP